MKSRNFLTRIAAVLSVGFDAWDQLPDFQIQSKQNKQKKKLDILITTSYLADICTIIGSLYFCNIDRTYKNYPRLNLFPLSLGVGAGGLMLHYGRRKEDEFKDLGF